MRSEMAANWMRSQGFTRVLNLTGGIDAWSMVVDPAVARY
jgi:rhodanese-related sulfurtransferase